jgi:hypothetical protein
MYGLLESLKGVLPEDELQSRRIVCMLFHQGYRINRAIKEGNEAEARLAADMVSSLTATKWFPYLSPMLVFIVVAAANVHAKLLAKATDQGARSILLERVKDDYRALVQMCERHKHLTRIHEKMIIYLDNVIRSLEESHLLNRLRESIPQEPTSTANYNFGATLFNFASSIGRTQEMVLVPVDSLNQRTTIEESHPMEPNGDELALDLLLSDVGSAEMDSAIFQSVDNLFENLL